MAKLNKKKLIVMALLTASLMPLVAEASNPGSNVGAFIDFSDFFKTLPPYVQAELEATPNNSESIPIYRIPHPPSLTVNVLLGASWRLDDGYGFWLGDGDSPLATAADYSAYDKAQTSLYLENRKNLLGFNEKLAKSLTDFSKKYQDIIKAQVNMNQAYQNLLLTYPEAVTKNYVIMYLRNRDMYLNDLIRNWSESENEIKRELRNSIGFDLGVITNYNVKGGMDNYVRIMNKQLVVSERQVIDQSWAPMTAKVLAPYNEFKPKELTIPEAEKMQWGVPPAPKAIKPRIVLPSTSSESNTLEKAYNALVNSPSSSTSSSHTSLIEQILALLILVGGGWFWLSRKKKNGRKKDNSDNEQ